MARHIRGTTAEQELNEEFLFRDTRSIVTKFFDFLAIPNNMVLILAMLTVPVFMFPSFSEIIFFIVIFLMIFGFKQKESAPIKMPIQSGLSDPHELNPGTGMPMPAQGIFFLGNEQDTKKEVWLTNSDCRQHFLVLGTTGAGKTETLLGFAANAVSWGSGFLFCDGKGDVSLFAKVYALCRRFGREDDLLVLNFMTGNQDVGGMGGRLMSNTMNPFANGSSDNLTQMVVGLMDDAGGDGAMWKGRATAMFTGVMRALGHLRDEGRIDLNITVIRDFLNLRRIIDLVDPQKYDIDQHIVSTVNSYLTSLPGYVPEKKYKQAQTTLDQHGYLEMQFTKILGSLSDVYGYIFKTPFGEVDMHDVVLNRRILVIMLPALEKSGDEIANLGKIVVATLKGMMGGTLGSKIEGDWESVVENRPTNSPSPFLTILDEVGYYTVEGMALMAAQARSLGFSMIYASQDIPAMKRLNEKEAQSIIANTNTKIFMRTEEASETGELFVKSAGEAMKAMATTFQGKAGNVSMGYMAQTEARAEKTARGNFLDLKQQSEGEMHIVFKEMVIRAISFYADPATTLNEKLLKLRANHFLKIAKPGIDEVNFISEIDDIIDRFIDPEFPLRLEEEVEEFLSEVPQRTLGNSAIAIVSTVLNHLEKDPDCKPIDASCASISDILNASLPKRNTMASTIINPPKEFDMDSSDGSESFSELDNFHAKVNPSISHSVTVDKDIIDIADEASRNEAMLAAMSALDYNENPPFDVSEDIDNALSENIRDEATLEQIKEVSTTVDKLVGTKQNDSTGFDNVDNDEHLFNNSADETGEDVTDFLESILNEDQDGED